MRDVVRHFALTASLMFLVFTACGNDGQNSSQQGEGYAFGQNRSSMLDYACDSETGGDVLYKQAVR